MTQNIYDQPGFFAAYSKLLRSIEGLAGAPEWPSLRAMLPDLPDRRVVDLGCGYGWFCRWAAGQGATSVLGLDVSEKMLARARAEPDPAISYQQMDLDQLSLPVGAFDVAYSSLALHYVADLPRLFREVQGGLAPGGWFVFSIEHPILMASRAPDWVTDAHGRLSWPVDGYSIEGPRSTDWLAKGVVKYHRTIGTTLTALVAAGFAIAQVNEFCPSAEQIAARPELERERERPTFLLVAARRSAAEPPSPIGAA